MNGDDTLKPRPDIAPDSGSKKEEAELEDKKEAARVGERGTLGRFFGGRDEKAGNVAGLMAICSFLLIAFLLLKVPRDMWEHVDAIGAVLGATLTACLGYLFGRK